jgi:PHD/YefM family antitoxin component YafN of YafNO toxin-antitoxin module
MNIPAEKLELMELLLKINSEEALKKVKAVLKKYSSASETEYLLSTEANRKHLKKSIAELNEGQGKAIKTADLWK